MRDLKALRQRYTVNTEGNLTDSDVNSLIGKAFRRYDKDGSGQMEAKEIRGCLRSLGVLVDEQEGQQVRPSAKSLGFPSRST